MRENKEPDLQVQIKALEDLIEMFSSDGWTEYTTYLNDVYTTARDTCEHLEDGNAFLVRKGNLQTLQFLRGFENLMRYQYEAVLEERDGRADADL